MKKTSGFLKLNWRDLLEGALAAGVSAVIVAVAPTLSGGKMPSAEQWVSAREAGLALGLLFILRALFTNSSGVPLSPEKKDETAQ